MRRLSYKPYIILALFLFVILNLPSSWVENVRSSSVALLTLPWRAFHFFKTKPKGITREIEVLRQENLVLHSQIEMLRHFLNQETLIEKEVKRIQEGEFFQRRREDLLCLVDLQARSVSARVIFREPVSWSSSLWINVGERNNQALKKRIVAKNSPVVVGTSVVGVVEYVGRKRSRVRLITDSGLSPSVRVVRYGEQDRFSVEQIESVIEDLAARGDYKEAIGILQTVKKSLVAEKEPLYLAKGEISGSSNPLWRSRGSTLQGRGFNYDFADEEGPARSLLSSDPPLVQVGDLLVTTGMDGVFPAGLRVAHVVHLQKLREGACAYTLEAKATAGDLTNLSYISVLPPLEESD